MRQLGEERQREAVEPVAETPVGGEGDSRARETTGEGVTEGETVGNEETDGAEQRPTKRKRKDQLTEEELRGRKRRQIRDNVMCLRKERVKALRRELAEVERLRLIALEIELDDYFEAEIRKAGLN